MITITNHRLLNLLTATVAVLAMTACGTSRQATTTQTTTPSTTTPTTTNKMTDAQRLDAIAAQLGDWQTLQTGGKMNLTGGKSLSSSMQMRMVRDQSVFISLRPMLGIEVAWLLVTADSVYAVDKVHKRYLAEKVSLLTAGVPVTVREVQDIFLGRPFVVGEGTYRADLQPQVTLTTTGNTCKMSPNAGYKGYAYTFGFDSRNSITTLDIVPQRGGAAVCQVRYSDVQSTTAGNIAQSIAVDANVDGSKFAFTLDYSNMEWNREVKAAPSLPTNYKRISAKSLASLLGD